MSINRPWFHLTSPSSLFHLAAEGGEELTGSGHSVQLALGGQESCCHYSSVADRCSSCRSLRLTSSHEGFIVPKAARGTGIPWQGRGALAVVETIFQELFTLGRDLQLEHSKGILAQGNLQDRVNLHAHN